MDGSATPALTLAGSGRPPLRNRWRLSRPDSRKNPLPTIVQAAYEQPVIRQTTPVGAFYLVADPDGVKRVFLDNVANYPKTAMERRFFSTVFGDGLLSLEGETWRAHRHTMAPAFSPANVAAYVPAMAEETEGLAALWAQAPPGEVRDVARDMTRLTLQIISRVMFAADGAALAETMEAAVSGAMAVVRPGLADFIPGLDRLAGARRRRRIARVFAELDAEVARLIAERERAPGGDDLLARLIAARDAETGAKMTAREVRDEMVTIFLAGHETTAAAMAWTWYLLSQHPEVEARLHAELDTVLGGRAPTAEELPRLAYTRMVLEEAMRLYPPAPGTSTRVALAEDEICGVRIPKGAYVIVAPWVSHRHQALWTRPERFQPERFDKAGQAGRPRFAYLPFGAGPRICVGASLAMSEMQVVLAILAQRCRPRLAPGHVVEIQHNVTMRPLGGLPMTLGAR